MLIPDYPVPASVELSPLFLQHLPVVLALFPTSQQSSSAFWKGDPALESLQRVYGISFPSPVRLEEWEQLQEEAASRDHRRIGKVGASVITHGQGCCSNVCVCTAQPAGLTVPSSDQGRDKGHGSVGDEGLEPSVPALLIGGPLGRRGALQDPAPFGAWARASRCLPLPCHVSPALTKSASLSPSYGSQKRLLNLLLFPAAGLSP